LINKLTNFLVDNDCYDKFITNLEKRPVASGIKTIEGLAHYAISIRKKKFIINSGFTWCYTEEGSSYWRDLYYKFIDGYDSISSKKVKVQSIWDEDDE